MGSPLDEVLDAFRALLDERAQVASGRDADRGNFRCNDCDGCTHCRFCSGCSDCEDCTYCDDCSECTGCTHCNGCERCSQTTHSAWSSACKDSSYVTLCLDCSGCVQCFACVGLRNEEFCILNEKLPRKTYFSRVAALRGAFEERIAAGWRPPWLEDDEDEEVYEDEDDDEDEAEAEDEDAYEVQDQLVAADVVVAQIAEAVFEHAEDADDDVRLVEPLPEAAAVVDDLHPADSSVSLQLEALWSSEIPSVIVDHDDSGPIVTGPTRTEPTIDTGEPVEADSRRDSHAWSGFGVRRSQAASREDDTQSTHIPEPPPFGAADADGVVRRRGDGPSGPLEGDEPTRRRDQATFDRYGWSAQTDASGDRHGWRTDRYPEREPERWPGPDDIRGPRVDPRDEVERDREGQNRRPWDPQDDLQRRPLPRWTPEDRERETRPSKPRSDPSLPRAGWTRDDIVPEAVPETVETERPSWANAETSEFRAMGGEEAPTRARWTPEPRGRWVPESPLSEPERRRLESDTILGRKRRRETAASPAAFPSPTELPRTDTDVETPPRIPARAEDPFERELDAWSPYQDTKRRLGPEERTEPDAPVRRNSVRAEISGVARASGRSSGPVELGEERRSSSRPVKVALGAGRRPERPRPPEPRERGGLLRGRPPARPAPPPTPRQTDAPSLRRARRPARAPEEATSKYRAALGTEESDPGTG